MGDWNVPKENASNPNRRKPIDGEPDDAQSLEWAQYVNKHYGIE